MATEEQQDSVSMVEVLEEEQKLEEDANAVLGGSDPVHCTYPKGYLARQALYSCATCTGSDCPPAGICLACSLECHEGHDLYELYTKRNFACDCGNSKFGSRECKLCPGKPATNEKNLYNQNFHGVYCTCHRPYPDPEDEVEDAMIQCVICEDWYHGRHLKADIPEDNNYEEMICYLCMNEHRFLKLYQHLQVVNDKSHHTRTEADNKDSCATVDVGGPENSVSAAVRDTPGGNCSLHNNSSANSSSLPGSTNSCAGDEKSGEQKILAELDKDGATSPTEAAKQSETVIGDAQPGSSGGCLLVHLREAQSEQPSDDCSVFWRQSWRKSLCQCAKCKDMYKSQNIPFISDLSDTITMYETRGRLVAGSSGTQYERGMEALSQMNRVQQVEVLHGFNDLKTELKDYLKKFAENGKVVKEEDIKEFLQVLLVVRNRKWTCLITVNK